MKQVILDEFCTNSGYNRKYAIRLLNGPPPEKKPRPRRRRSASYGAGLIRLLAAVLGGGGVSPAGCFEGGGALWVAPGLKKILFGWGNGEEEVGGRRDRKRQRL